MISYGLKIMGCGRELSKIFPGYQFRQFKTLFSASRLEMLASTYFMFFKFAEYKIFLEYEIFLDYTRS